MSYDSDGDKPHNVEAINHVRAADWLDAAIWEDEDLLSALKSELPDGRSLDV